MGKTIMYEQIYSDLLNKIQRGIFAQGDKLPSEKELSEEYGVSRITSKRALDILAENQYITRSRGKGSFVTGNQGDILARNVFPEEEAILKKPLIGVVFDTFGSWAHIRINPFAPSWRALRIASFSSSILP